MSVKIAVVANCQAASLVLVLPRLNPSVQTIKIPAVHTIKPAAAAGWAAALAEADVILHQPISAAFGALATDALKKSFPDKRFISFPSIHFAGYFPHLVTLRKPGGGTLGSALGDFHDARVALAFHQGLSVKACLQGLDKQHFDLTDHYAACLAESRRREAALDIPVLDDLLARSQRRQTLYTVNHPDNDTMIGVARRCLQILGLPEDKGFEAPQKKLMGWVIAAVPDSVSQALGHGWRTPDYTVAGKVLPMQDLVESCYETYRGCEGFDSLIAFNRHRFAAGLRAAGAGQSAPGRPGPGLSSLGQTALGPAPGATLG